MTVRELRKKLGWTQERMAREAGCTLKSISRYESGCNVGSKMRDRLRGLAEANGIEGFAPNCPCCGRPL